MPISREAKIRTEIQTAIGAILNITKNIANVVLTSNIVTITTATAHGFQIGHYVTITSVGNPSINGTYPITEVPSTTEFSFALTHADIASVADTGTAVQQNARLGLEEQVCDGSDFYANLPSGGFCMIAPANVGKWTSQVRQFPIEVTCILWFRAAADASIDFLSFEDVWSAVIDALANTTNVAWQTAHPDEMDMDKPINRTDLKPNMIFEYTLRLTFPSGRGAA